MSRATPFALLRELEHNANASGNQPMERRLADLTLWFYKNIDDIPRDNLAGRQAFLEKTLEISFEAMALMLERIHELEAKRGGGLWMPKGVAVEGDLRKFG